MKKIQKKLQLLSLLLVAGLLFSSVVMPAKAFIQKSGTVNEAVTLRQNPDSGSSQVMELTNGQAVTVNNELTGEDGAKWYQIFVNGTTLGYVPVGTITISSNNSSQTSNPGNTGTSQNTQTVTVTERIGTVTANSAIRVRAEASTSSAQVASMESQDTFLVLSDVNASDGYVWYEVNFDDHGTEVHGYGRSDLVSVKEITREEQVPADNTPAQVPSEPSDTSAPYSITTQTNAEGVTVWYLMDNSTGDAKEISSLLAPQEVKSDNGVYKIIVVILLILVIVAAAAATFFYMRWQDAEEFIDELREKQAHGRKQPAQPTRTAPTKPQQPVKQAPAKQAVPVSKSATAQPAKASQPLGELTPKNMVKKQTTVQPKSVDELVSKQATPTAPVQTPVKPESKPAATTAAQEKAEEVLPKTADIVKTAKQEIQNKQTSTTANAQPQMWRSKNFLTEDDDLEFDFLDMDDK